VGATVTSGMCAAGGNENEEEPDLEAAGDTIAHESGKTVASKVGHMI